MEILVLGGSGYLSRAVAETCRDEGHAVTVFTRGVRPLPEGVSAITGDRSEIDAFARAFEGRPFDAVIDCICYRPDEAAADVRAFAGRVGRLVMISTDFVYGPHRALPMDEITPTEALNHYGQDKAACEALLLTAHREEGFPVTILRPPHIMGAGGQLGTGSLQGRDPMLLDRLERGEPIVLLDGGQLLIQPVVHRDIARACLAAVASEKAVGQAYNVAGPDCVTTRAYYEIIAATLGVEPRFLSLPSDVFVRADPQKAPFAQHRMYSVEKLLGDTGYRPGTTLRHAIFEMVDWLQAYGPAVRFEGWQAERELVVLLESLEADAAKNLVTP
jgi:nucleoside-diphosphate-sugar epimerase